MWRQPSQTVAFHRFLGCFVVSCSCGCFLICLVRLPLFAATRSSVNTAAPAAARTEHSSSSSQPLPPQHARRKTHCRSPGQLRAFPQLPARKSLDSSSHGFDALTCSTRLASCASSCSLLWEAAAAASLFAASSSHLQDGLWNGASWFCCTHRFFSSSRFFLSTRRCEFSRPLLINSPQSSTCRRQTASGGVGCFGCGTLEFHSASSLAFCSLIASSSSESDSSICRVAHFFEKNLEPMS